MIRDDRELLAELARLNTDMPMLGLRIMEGSVSSSEPRHYAERLIAVGQRLRRRTENAEFLVVEGSVEAQDPLALPTHSVQPLDLDRRT